MTAEFSQRLPQFILTLVLLGGFALMVITYMAVNLDNKNQEIVKTIITGMGQACLLALGYWFGQGGLK